MQNSYQLILSVLITIAFTACNNGPKVIEPSSGTDAAESNSGIFTPNPDIQVSSGENTSFGEDLHKVMVEEVLPTDRYIYLRVKEDTNRKFWIAARKQDVSKGEVYFYRRPLLKTNFESKEYDRVFDTIYLVSNLVAEDHSKHVGDLNPSTPQTVSTDSQKEDIPTHTDEVVEHKGTLKIAELVKDPSNYEGHTIQISGTCVKVNPNIMNRNWLHIQDGSKNDFDLVVTSDSFVPEGSHITVRATVSLNRDFGAGYKYDLILENGTVIK
jgi:hypothetical protein